jgi:predicted transcriptional regulator
VPQFEKNVVQDPGRQDLYCPLGIVCLVARDSTPLSLEVRRRIYDHVRRYPGLHLSEIARALSMDKMHARYHLDRLHEHDLVSIIREDQYVRYFPRQETPLGARDEVARDEKPIVALLRQAPALRIVLLLLEHRQLTFTAASEHLDLPRATLHYQIGRLEKAELIDNDRDGRERVIRLRDEARIRGILRRHRPPDALVQGFLDAWEDLEL